MPRSSKARIVDTHPAADIALDVADAPSPASLEAAPPAPEPAPPEPEVVAPRQTKQALVLAMLKRKDGVTLTELASATGWQPHTTRAALTGLRKRGHAITSEKADKVTRYRIGDAR